MQASSRVLAEDLQAKALCETYLLVRQASLELVLPLSAEDMTAQSMPDASPTKWHLAHTTWFFETFVLLPHLPGYQVFNEQFRELFNSYYVGAGKRFPRAERGVITRPGAKAVKKYREYVDSAMDVLFENGLTDEVKALIELGINHEEQHQELILTDLKHLLSHNPLKPFYLRPKEWKGEASDALWWLTLHMGETMQLGNTGRRFSFDNELPQHTVYLAPFELASRLSTNYEYLAFIEAGGYTRPELWLSDGYDAVQKNAWEHPLYWKKEEDGWYEFTLGGWIPLDLDAPVAHVSYYEADAFARWSRARLPTEAEWEYFAAHKDLNGPFRESGYLRPVPYEQSEENIGQLYGDVWQWTSSSYAPYPGFQTAEGAVGEYNGKFMSGQMVLRGASCFTPKRHARTTYRNFLRHDARWQCSGIRLARDYG